MKKVNKIQLYGIESYSQDQLMKMKESIFKYAEAINGLPKNHMEVLEKRGGYYLSYMVMMIYYGIDGATGLHLLRKEQYRIPALFLK